MVSTKPNHVVLQVSVVPVPSGPSCSPARLHLPPGVLAVFEQELLYSGTLNINRYKYIHEEEWAGSSLYFCRLSSCKFPTKLTAVRRRGPAVGAPQLAGLPPATIRLRHPWLQPWAGILCVCRWHLGTWTSYLFLTNAALGLFKNQPRARSVSSPVAERAGDTRQLSFLALD